MTNWQSKTFECVHAKGRVNGELSKPDDYVYPQRCYLIGVLPVDFCIWLSQKKSKSSSDAVHSQNVAQRYI